MTPADREALRNHWLVVSVLAAAVLMLTMGTRQSWGLFISPMNTSTGIGIVGISFALAVGQFVWGAVQPVAGLLAERYGALRVLAGGMILLAFGSALTPWMGSTWALCLSIGLIAAAGSGAGSFSVLIGLVAQRLPSAKRGMASGIINAGGSFGQFVFAPITQALIVFTGWMNTMWILAAIVLAGLPLLRGLATGAAQAQVQAAGGPEISVAHALRDRSYLLLHAGFFTCGFHIAFLVTHLPGEVNLCGLPADVASTSLAIIGLANIMGSLAAGWWVQRYRSKMVLFWMYGSRAALILAYLAAPKTALTFYIFAIGLGFTWLATVPPTAAVVGKLFGTRRLATLFGLTLLSHQTGAFFGAWLGGVAFVRWGNLEAMWWADIVLATAAALCNLPIREAKLQPQIA